MIKLSWVKEKLSNAVKDLKEQRQIAQTRKRRLNAELKTIEAEAYKKEMRKQAKAKGKARAINSKNNNTFGDSFFNSFLPQEQTQRKTTPKKTKKRKKQESYSLF